MDINEFWVGLITARMKNLLIDIKKIYIDILSTKHITYEDWNVCVNSCFSSPLWFMVKILIIGMPTALYDQTSCKITLEWII